MHADVGDRIVVHGHKTGEPNREAEVLEVHGEHGEPPFVVRWHDDGRIATYYPGPDAMVQHEDPNAPPVVMNVETDDPVRRDLLEGIVALRTDVLRLRAALSRISAAGGELRAQASSSLARRVGQVECEVAALSAEVKAGQADTVAAVRSALDDAARTVRTVLDDLRVQAHLGGSEADEAWQQVVSALGRLRDDPAVTMDAAKSIAADVAARLRAAVS